MSLFPRLVRGLDQLEIPGFDGQIVLNMADTQIIEGLFRRKCIVLFYIGPDMFFYFTQVLVELLEYQKIHQKIVGEAGKQKKYDHYQQVDTVVSGKELHFVALSDLSDGNFFTGRK